MKRHTCISRNGCAWGGAGGNSALRDAQYLPYIVFKCFARTLQTTRYDFGENRSIFMADPKSKSVFELMMGRFYSGWNHRGQPLT